jgi:hypothetical protein
MKLLLPGVGGRDAQTITLTADSVAHNSDPYDMSRCSQFAVQVTTWAAGNLTLQVLQSVDGTSYATLGSNTTVVAGDIIRIDITSGPLCLIKFQLKSTDTAANATLTTVGYPNQWSN